MTPSRRPATFQVISMVGRISSRFRWGHRHTQAAAPLPAPACPCGRHTHLLLACLQAANPVVWHALTAMAACRSLPAHSIAL